MLETANECRTACVGTRAGSGADPRVPTREPTQARVSGPGNDVIDAAINVMNASDIVQHDDAGRCDDVGRTGEPDPVDERGGPPEVVPVGITVADEKVAKRPGSKRWPSRGYPADSVTVNPHGEVVDRLFVVPSYYGGEWAGPLEVTLFDPRRIQS